MTTIHDYVTFADNALAQAWTGKKVPMSDVYEAYIEGKLDIPSEKWNAFWDSRNQTMSFRLTDSHVKWAVTNFIPEVFIHSKSQDKRVVGDNYNRGNDFYNWFLGEAMVYTSAWFPTPETSLEQAQYAKIDHCCDKLMLKPGETLLDIGGGWGRSARSTRSGCASPRSRSRTARSASRRTASRARGASRCGTTAT